MRSQASIRRLFALVSVSAFAVAGCVGGFAPQGSPAATDVGALGCQIGPQPGATVRTGDPLAAGEPMADVNVTALTPRQVGELARSRGLKVTWRYDYAIAGGMGLGGLPLAVGTPSAIPAPGSTPAPSGSDRPANETASPSPSPGKGGGPAGVSALGYSECWCEPPPDGRVIGVAYGMASELIVFVESDRTLPAPRDQPPRGWGC